MRYIIFFCILVFPFSVFAASEDNSVIDELESTKAEKLDVDYTMKSFESCDAFEDVMEEYIKEYWKNNYQARPWYRGGGIFSNPMPEVMMQDEAASDSAEQKVSNGVGGGNDFSSTNIQIAGVDESDIVKTDGEYIYYYNDTEKAVYVIEALEDSETIIHKKINLPKSFYNTTLYLTDSRLTVLASGYSEYDYSKRGYYINRNAKTYTIVFDREDPKKPSLIKLNSADGDYTKSRRIGDYVYVLSRNYFNFPYYEYKSEDDIEIEASMLLPKHIDITRTDTISEQNLTLKGKDLPFSVTSENLADCRSISYNFPDIDTLENVNFNPGYNIISIINIEDIEEDVETEVIAGSNSEIFMSTENLYLTESIWQANNYSCPPNMMCSMPIFWGGVSNTLVHKMNINENSISYQDSALVPGSPLNQYSMDEYEGDFRIITSMFRPEASTGLYILDEDLESVSSLTNLAPGETFQSSRFIGDKLFLVTFEQIDPLFAIDLSDNTDPTVLGELKIPGFSTYLHPYDETHLIGLGYDTAENQWGGVQTSGVKLDLYKINYDKKCGDTNLTDEENTKCESGDYKGIIVEQLHSKTFGGKGSDSEALRNPRMFVWNPNRNTLLLPVNLSEHDDNYRITDYYNGMLSISVSPELGILERGRNTHLTIEGIEEKRQEECSKYSSTGEPQCRELLNGELYCDDEVERGYVPNYCFKDSSVWTYVGERQWDFNNAHMKRALYIGENVYGLSDSKVGTYSWSMDEKSISEY